MCVCVCVCVSILVRVCVVTMCNAIVRRASRLARFETKSTNSSANPLRSSPSMNAPQTPPVGRCHLIQNTHITIETLLFRNDIIY